MVAELFEIGPVGIPRVNAVWQRPIEGLTAAIRARVGDRPRVNCWPYRLGNVGFVSLDLAGSKGNVNLTIYEADVTEIERLWANETTLECRVADLVDAFYLVVLLLDALGFDCASSPVSTFLPRTIAK